MNIRFPLILDGAMGTRLYAAGMPAGVCPEQWVLDHPEAALEIQRSYVDAGSQVIYAPTFGGNAAALKHNGVSGPVELFNGRLVSLARQAADGRALVGGDISSTGGMLCPMGDMSFEEFCAIYLEQAAALEKAGADLFVIETMTDLAEARAALLAVKAVSAKPVFVTFSCDVNGRTMMGTDVCAALQVMQGMGADAFGLNCSAGPAEMLPQICRLAEYAAIPLIAKPNAGLPQRRDGKTVYTVGPEEFASYVPALAKAGVNIFGACCGSDERYISALKSALEGVPMKSPAPAHSGLLPCATEKDVFPLDADDTYSRVFSCDDELEDNLGELDPGELFAVRIRTAGDVDAFSDAQYAIRNPLCICCDDAALLEKTLRAYQGRPLYEGSLSDAELLPLVKKYGLILR